MPEHSPAPTPHRAVYGFAFYLLFFTLFVLYLLWAFLPLQKLGLTYAPDKYFALFIPMVVLVGIAFFFFFIYPAIGLAMTPDVDDITAVVDVSLIPNADLRHKEHFWEEISKTTQNFKYAAIKQRKTIENCKYCHGTHKSVLQERVPPLHFIDLKQMNAEVFHS